jgi:hypothetical protein
MVTNSSGGSPMMGRAPTGVVDLGEASELFGFAREAAHQRDGTIGQWLGLGSVFAKILHEGSPISRVLIPTHRRFSILTNIS